MTEQETQRVVVLAGRGGISVSLATMAAALDIALVAVHSHHDLPFQLHHWRPMGVISETDPTTEASCAALRCIAAYDQDLPVLLVSRNDPKAEGTIDAAEKLWGLSSLHQLVQSPGPAELIQFLFQASRQTGQMRLMPIG